MDRIASFSVDHDLIVPGIYVSRSDGDVTTYDLRTRVPNCGDYMDNITMHSVEHLFATFARNSALSSDVIYFGPMGCQTGFYLLMRNADNDKILDLVKEILTDIIAYDGDMPGAHRKECGNYKNLSVESAKVECRAYLTALNNQKNPFIYPVEA